MDAHDPLATRRRILISAGRLAGALALGPLLRIEHARATGAEMQAAVRAIVGEAQVNVGRVALDVPPLVENGNTVPLTVAVESPMTAADHVKAIHVFNEKNPQPDVASFYLGPRNGRATVSARIRLADSQQVVAIAQMSDGSFWSDTADVLVTIAACTEDL